MKHRRILSGIASFLVVGMFYTFAFCVVQDVNDENISTEFYTAEEEVPGMTENTAAEKRENAVDARENKKEITNVSLEEDYREIKDDNIVNAGLPVLRADLPSGIVLPDALPEDAGDSPEDDNGENEEITDSDYAENSGFDGDISEEEMDELFPEEEDIVDYSEMSANAGNARSSSGEDSASTSSKKKRKKKKNTQTAASSETASASSDDVFEDVPFVSFENSSDESSETLSDDYDDDDTEFEEIKPANIIEADGDWDGTVSIDRSGDGKAVKRVSTSETLTVKVRGEICEYNAYDLVCMIVANEMSPSFGKEALKAQAVAAYSYVKYHEYNGLVPSVLVREDIPEEVREAVNEVFGQCCYYNGAPAQTVYTASTSGFTASAANVWGGSEVPYLIHQTCAFDVKYDPNYGICTTYTEDEMRSKLESYLGCTLSDRPERWLIITEYEDGNYVKNISVDGEYSLNGRQFREGVMKYGIKSASFEIFYEDGTFTVKTYGYGHGVGMSQNGANILAKQGYTYDEILKFYFPGVTVQ